MPGSKRQPDRKREVSRQGIKSWEDNKNANRVGGGD